MNRILQLIVLIFVFSLSTSDLIGQKWLKMDEQDISRSNFTREIIPSKFLTYTINIESLKSNLEPSPNRFKNNGSASVIMNIPKADGSFEKFSMTRSDVFHPDLTKKYPKIQSYTGTSLNNPGTILKLSVSHNGIKGMILSDEGPTQYIDPYARETTDTYIVYDKNAFHKHLYDGEGTCTVEHPEDEFTDLDSEAKYGDCQLRKYRLALACTGEYANFHGGNVPDVLAEYNASMTRVNGIYEREFAITMELIADTDDLIYFNASTDPYTNNDGGVMLTENQNNVDVVIGFNNYDIGHVFSTGGGGIASLRSPCTIRKARGVTGLGNPTGDPFWVDYVAHEMGHQFGGNHTQNNDCQRRDATAMEPGSASTIMGYAGICSPNVQNNSDDYFHAVNVQEVANFVVAGNGGCAETLTIDNNPPELETPFGGGLVLPISTPFALTAIASDDDEDPLTYCWEQYDNEAADMPPESNSSVGPAFRSYNPTANPTRYFPRMSSILFGTNGNTWERLPSVSRDMRFNITVRDNNTLGGCTADDDLSFTFTNAAGPFEVTSQNTNETWSAGNTETITWDVANTDQAPVNCAEVDIYLSVDGGENFDILVLENTPNDGEQEINVPFQFSDQCRLMIKCASSIFLDVNDSDFSIMAPFAASISPTSQFVCKTDPVNYEIDYTSFSSGLSVSFDVDGLPTGAVAEFSPNTINDDGFIDLSITNIENVEPGEYDMIVSIISPDLTLEQNITLIVSSDSAAPIDYLSPANEETNVNIFPFVSWQDDPSIVEYEIQISKNPSFDVLNYNQLVNQSSINDAELETETVYYWRVRPISICYESDWNETQSFQTVGLLCNTGIGESNITIPETVSEITSSLMVSESEIIVSTEVSLLINHTFVGDLIAVLESPTGKLDTLFDQPGVPDNQFGCGNDNLNLTFSDFAPNTAENLEGTCEPGDFAIQGNYQPITPFSNLNGDIMSGEWKLTIYDTFADDGGELVEWSLTTCSAISIPSAVIINNVPLSLENEVSKIISSDNLSMENSEADNTTYIIRNVTKNGILQLMNSTSGEFETMNVGSKFTQADIDNNAVQYALLNTADNSDMFTFDIIDDQNRYLANQQFNISSSFIGLTISAEITIEIACFGDMNGEITAEAAGGIAPLTYSIDGESFSDSNVFSNLSPDNYTVTVRDANGNETSSIEINISQPNQLIVNLQFGQNDVTIDAEGGTEPYQYSTDGIDFEDIDNIPLIDGESYTIYVKDANGCISEADEFTHYFISATTYDSNDVFCFGESTGSLSVLAVEGGLAPYLYTLNGVTNNTGIFTDLPSDDYELLVQDSDGNEYTETVIISEPELLVISTTVNQDSIFVEGNGGIPPYAYSLDGIIYDDNSTLIGEVGETYTVYLQDLNGCVTTVDGIEIISAVSNPVLNALKMYPNPAINSIQFGSDANVSFGYTINDITGKTILSGKALSNSKIDISSLPQGMFICTLSIENSQKSYRLIVVE